MQSPSTDLIKKHYPQSLITAWLAPRSTKQIAHCLPAIDQIIEAPIKQPLTNHLSLISQFRRLNFSTGIIMSPGQLIKSATYLFLCGIPTRVGHKYPLGKNPQSGFLLTHAIKENPNLHDIEQNLKLLKALNIPLPQEPTTYSLNLPNQASQKADNIFDNLNITAGQKIIGFHPGSSPDHVWKRWPSQNFIALGQQLGKKFNAHILIFGGPQEEKLKNKIVRSIGLTHASSISSSLLISAALIKKCGLFISNDSGLMHLAAALNTPTLGLFGPTNEKHTGPRGHKSFTIRAPKTSPSYNTEKNYRLGSNPHPDIKTLKVNHVLEKINSINF